MRTISPATSAASNTISIFAAALILIAVLMPCGIAYIATWLIP